ncbi:MAG: DUF1972 domain-containing protein [bacterium]
MEDSRRSETHSHNRLHNSAFTSGRWRQSPPPGKTVAFCGTRGLPANYGGFETAVDEISRRFVDNEYDCEVFCRLSATKQSLSEHRGRRLVYVRGSSHRKLETFVSSVQTGWHLLRHRRQYGHVFWFNNANFPGILLAWLARIPMSVNTDGLEWRRAKWSWPFKSYSYLSSFLISRMCRTLISDSCAIQGFYRRRFFKKTNFIPYGCPVPPTITRREEDTILNKFDLEKSKYFLQITRIEPDNLPVRVAAAFHESGLGETGFKMVFIGYKDPTPYAQRLVAFDGRHGVCVMEANYDAGVLQVLRGNCFCYVHGNSVGGTNPALLEAMATCPRLMAIDCEFSREVLGSTGMLFDPAVIAATFKQVLLSPDHAPAMQQRVRQHYQWDAVADAYIRLAKNAPADYRVSATEIKPQAQQEYTTSR